MNYYGMHLSGLALQHSHNRQYNPELEVTTVKLGLEVCFIKGEICSKIKRDVELSSTFFLMLMPTKYCHILLM